MKAITADKLSFSFGKQQVLKDISLEVETGEFFIIIGPNGTGKTTLLKTIAGLLKPSAGIIKIHGHALEKMKRREVAKILAMVPQQTALDFPFTVTETVLMGRSPFIGTTSIEGEHDHTIANQSMKFTEVEHLANRPLTQLSGGERQRAIIARAICQQPRIILLDEPTASLDPSHQIRIMDLMEKLRHEHNITIMMVSHDLNLAALFAHRLLLLGKNGIESIGSPEKVLEKESLEKVYGCEFTMEKSSADLPMRVFPVSNMKPMI